MYHSVLQGRKPTSQVIDVVSLAKTSAGLDHKQNHSPEKGGGRARTEFIYHTRVCTLSLQLPYWRPVCGQKHIGDSFRLPSPNPAHQEVTCSSPIFPDRETERVSGRPHRKQSPQLPKRGPQFQAEGPPHELVCPPTPPLRLLLRQTPLPTREASRHFYLPH